MPGINCGDLVVLGLATWRISSILVNEDGPFDIFFKMRERFKEGLFFDGLFSCVWCISVWIGTFLVLSAIMNKTLTLYLMLPFALSAIAVILEENING